MDGCEITVALSMDGFSTIEWCLKTRAGHWFKSDWTSRARIWQYNRRQHNRHNSIQAILAAFSSTASKGTLRHASGGSVKRRTVQISSAKRIWKRCQLKLGIAAPVQPLAVLGQRQTAQLTASAGAPSHRCGSIESPQHLVTAASTAAIDPTVAAVAPTIIVMPEVGYARTVVVLEHVQFCLGWFTSSGIEILLGIVHMTVFYVRRMVSVTTVETWRILYTSNRRPGPPGNPITLLMILLDRTHCLNIYTICRKVLTSYIVWRKLVYVRYMCHINGRNFRFQVCRITSML